MSEHQRQQLAVRAVVLAELRRLWPVLDPFRLDETFPGWVAAAAPLVMRGRQMSTVVANRYLRRLRAAAGVPGEASPGMPRDFPLPVLTSSLAVTGPVAIKVATGRGDSIKEAVDSAFVLTSKSVSRHVLNAGREAALSSLQADPHAAGWQRVASPGACDFCRPLALEYSVGKGDFKAHDGCACSVEPIYA